MIPRVELEKARELIDRASLLMQSDADRLLINVLRQQQRALAAMNARLEQHFVGGASDHPELRR